MAEADVWNWPIRVQKNEFILHYLNTVTLVRCVYPIHLSSQIRNYDDFKPLTSYRGISDPRHHTVTTPPSSRPPLMFVHRWPVKTLPFDRHILTLLSYISSPLFPRNPSSSCQSTPRPVINPTPGLRFHAAFFRRPWHLALPPRPRLASVRLCDAFTCGAQAASSVIELPSGPSLSVSSFRYPSRAPLIKAITLSTFLLSISRSQADYTSFYLSSVLSFHLFT